MDRAPLFPVQLEAGGRRRAVTSTPSLMFATFTVAFAVALDQLRVNPLRTILSTLGVIIGVGALVAVLSLGDGMERFVRTQVESTT